MQRLFHSVIVSSADTRQVDVAVPVVGVAARGVVAVFLQGLYDALVARLYDAGAETVLVLHPCRVGLEPGLLLRQHLDDAVGRAVEHTLTRSDLRGLQRLYVVGAVGHAVEHVDVLQVLTVDEARVTQQHIERGVAVAAVEVPEGYGLQVVVAGECLLLHEVELVVVVRADVVEQAHAALVSVKELVVGRDGRQVVDGVSADPRLFPRGVVLVADGIVHAVLRVHGVFLHRLVDEVLLELAPYLVFQEVLLTVFGYDDLQLCGVAAVEDVVATEDEVLRAEATVVVLVARLTSQLCPVDEAETLQVAASGKG